MRTKHEEERFDDANRDYMATALSLNRLFAVTVPGIMLIMNLSLVAVLYLGAFRVESGEMPIGNLTAFTQYIMQILMSIMMATLMLVMVPRAVVSGGRIREVLDTRPTIEDPATPRTPTLRGHVELRGVSFGYPGAEDPVLREITFEARPGETTAIVGSTGTGKSTLVNLLPRLYDVTAGAVLVDGVDVREVDRQELWSRIGMVPQKAYLFSGTVASNLRYGAADATDEQLWQALEVAQARDFVSELPEGLEAPIAQGGTNLSGGQRQRLAIARALVKRPDIYVFDDSFSALDFRTDARLRAALARELDEATVIIVAQRVGTILQRRPHRRPRRRRRGRHGHPWPAHGDLPDVSGDRPVAGDRGGGRMTGRPGFGPGAMGRPGGPGAMGRPGPGFGFGLSTPAAKSADFRTSFRRLLGELRPERGWILIVLAFGVVSVVLAVIGPKLLGEATNIIFDGLRGPADGRPRSLGHVDRPGRRAAPGRRARRTSRTCSRPPARRLAWASTSRRSPSVLALVAGAYVLSALFAWAQARIMAGVTQRVVYGLRRRMDEKIGRLPLATFDRQLAR